MDTPADDRVELVNLSDRVASVQFGTSALWLGPKAAVVVPACELTAAIRQLLAVSLVEIRPFEPVVQPAPPLDEGPDVVPA